MKPYASLGPNEGMKVPATQPSGKQRFLRHELPELKSPKFDVCMLWAQRAISNKQVWSFFQGPQCNLIWINHSSYTGWIQWILSQCCGCWWHDVLAPGHQQQQNWPLNLHIQEFPVINGLTIYVRDTEYSRNSTKSTLYKHGSFQHENYEWCD